MKLNIPHRCLVIVSLFVTMLSLHSVSVSANELEQKIKTAFEAGELSGLHSVLVIHEGKVVSENHFAGDDYRWGAPLGMREHGADTLHDLRSVTKPIVGLLYGIALAEGKVAAIDQSLIAQMSEYSDLADESDRKAILINHTLSMKMGTEWNEELPYTDARNSEIAMEQAEDRYRYALDRPMVNKPGEQWVYNGGAVAVIGKLISDGVGMSIDQYAREKLFQPLGITDFEWVRGEDNVPSAASGLRLNIHDLAKIGQLIVQDGQFDGQQVVPADWLQESFKPRSELPTGLRYGYFWWLAPWGTPPAWVAGFGNGGQRLTVQAEHDLIIAVYAGNYNQAQDWKLPVKLIENFVVPVLKSKISK